MLNPGESNSRRAVTDLLFYGDARIALYECDSTRRHGRNSGVHPDGRMDDSRGSHCQCLPLDFVLALLCVWRILMDYLISPRVMGRELEVHPLLTIFAMMVGGALGGIVGIYLSMPLLATLRVVYSKSAARETGSAVSDCPAATAASFLDLVPTRD